LFKEKMIKQRFDSCCVQQLVVRKVENPETKKNSGYSTDFSWELWNTPAQEYYMQSIEALSYMYERTLEIFKEAYQLTDWLGRRSPFIQVDNDILNTACTSLHSNDEDPGTFDDGVDGAEHQADDGSWDSNVMSMLRLEFREGPPLLIMMATTWTVTHSVLQSRSDLKLAKLPFIPGHAHMLSRLELLPAP
jgi:hypothetical protein